MRRRPLLPPGRHARPVSPAIALLVSFLATLAGCRPNTLESGNSSSGDPSRDQNAHAFRFDVPAELTPSATLKVSTTHPKVVAVEYIMNGTFPIGKGTDRASGFPAPVQFPTNSTYGLMAKGLDAAGAVLAQAVVQVTVAAPGAPAPGGGVAPPKAPVAGKTCCTRPLVTIPGPTSSEGWVGSAGGGRQFGASRGSRKHAACDLLAGHGTPVYAVADGVIQAFEDFYSGTWNVEVLHGDFDVNYGEVTPGKLGPGLKVGSKVKRGQVIAYVQRHNDTGYSMLHFELYKGTAKGRLVGGSNAYKRRSDVTDPTEWLKKYYADPAAKPGAQ